MKTHIKTALGEQPADIVLKGGYVADVFNHRIIKTDVAIVTYPQTITISKPHFIALVKHKDLRLDCSKRICIALN